MPACRFLCDSAISAFVLLALEMLQRWMTTSCTAPKPLCQGISFGHVLALAPHTPAGSNPCSQWTSLLQRACATRLSIVEWLRYWWRWLWHQNWGQNSTVFRLYCAGPETTLHLGRYPPVATVRVGSALVLIYPVRLWGTGLFL